MTTPQQPAPAAPAAPAGQGDSEPGRIKTIEELSARQDTMDGKLDRILAGLTGHQQQQQQPAAPAAAGAPDPGTVQDQMRAAIRAVRAEERAAQQQAGAQPQQPAAPPAERQPREPGPSLKARWQRAMFGAQT